MIVKFKKDHPNAKLPIYKTKGSSGADLYSVENITLKPGDIKGISTGLQLAFCELGYDLQIRTRSGMALKGIIVGNSPGSVDADFRGKILVILTNISPNDYVVKEGDRIAQLVIEKVEQYNFEFTNDVQETERAANGFGSSGR